MIEFFFYIFQGIADTLLLVILALVALIPLYCAYIGEPFVIVVITLVFCWGIVLGTIKWTHRNDYYDDDDEDY